MVLQRGDEPAGAEHDVAAEILPRSRFLRRLEYLWASPLNVLGALLALSVVVEALIGRAVSPYSPTLPQYGAAFSAPSVQHLFGTDEVGRDVFSRVLSGAGTAMEVVVVVVGIGAICGTLVGLISGYAGGWIDEILMRLTDIFLAFPILV